MNIKEKRKVKYLGALTAAGFLAVTACSPKEKTFKLSNCEVIVENHPDGTVSHHFITECHNMYNIETEDAENYKKFTHEYQTITNENVTISDSIFYYKESDENFQEIPKTNGQYIFDYNVPYFKMDAEDIKLPEGYSLYGEYNALEIKELENKLSKSIYEINKKDTYDIAALLIVKLDGEYICFDLENAAISTMANFSQDIKETDNVEDVTKLREVGFIPSIGNHLFNLKISEVKNGETNDKVICSYGERNYAYEDITSLDETIRNDLRSNKLEFKNIRDYLTPKQIYENDGRITASELAEVLDKLNSPEYKLVEKVEELTEQNELVNVYYSIDDDDLTISKKENASGNLPEKFYEELNTVIKDGNIKRIYLNNLDNTFDLTKLNTSEEMEITLRFENYEGTLDCSSLRGKQEFYFTNTKGNSAAEIVSTCCDPSMTIRWKEDIEQKSELETILEELVNNNIQMRVLDIKENDLGNYNGITDNEFELLSKINAKSIYIDAEGFKRPLNLNLELNPKIENLSIEVYKEYNKETYQNGELGNIKIQSDNKDLYCSFYQADITKNTRFSLPDSTYVRIHNLNCTSIRAFKDLKNIKGLEFKEELHANGMADLRGEMVYSADGSYESYFGERVYTDYNQFLKELEYFFKRKQLRERMNLAPGYSYYDDDKKIGAYATLESDNVKVYRSLSDLRNRENPLTSYFGEEELRCISTICLAQDEQEINVKTMEECDVYLDAGYEIIGCTFINIYATSEDDREIYVPIEEVKLKHTPFE